MAGMAKGIFNRMQKKEALLKLSAGRAVRVISREYGISTRTLYRWRVSLARGQEPTGARLRLLEEEHRRLQKQFAELTLDYTTLRAALLKDVKGDC